MYLESSFLIGLYKLYKNRNEQNLTVYEEACEESISANTKTMNTVTLEKIMENTRAEQTNNLNT